VDRTAGLDLGAGFVGLSGDRQHGNTAGRHAVGDRPVRTAYAFRADGDEAGGGDVPVCRAADRRGAPGIEAETRAAPEAGSAACRLLEEKLSARERVAACNCCAVTAPASTPRASRKSAGTRPWPERRRSQGSTVPAALTSLTVTRLRAAELERGELALTEAARGKGAIRSQPRWVPVAGQRHRAEAPRNLSRRCPGPMASRSPSRCHGYYRK